MVNNQPKMIILHVNPCIWLRRWHRSQLLEISDKSPDAVDAKGEPRIFKMSRQLLRHSGERR